MKRKLKVNATWVLLIVFALMYASLFGGKMTLLALAFVGFVAGVCMYLGGM